MSESRITRRDALLTGSAVLVSATTGASAGESGVVIAKPIPSSGERLPVIGMGSWLTFDVDTDDRAALTQRVDVVREFIEAGGTVIDSSPMYMRSPDVIGAALARLGAHGKVFSGSKVWTVGRRNGIEQMTLSARRWGVDRFDLMQVHNLVDMRVHAATLGRMKDAGELRYTGITTSHGRRHAATAAAIRDGGFDFAQFTYNIADRDAERRLLPLAADTGTAVIVNRPFRTGALFRAVRGKPLPPWAGDLGCRTWAQFMLKFVVSHPAVTVAIPATRRPEHMRENMVACTGALPDAAARRDMAAWFDRVSA